MKNLIAENVPRPITPPQRRVTIPSSDELLKAADNINVPGVPLSWILEACIRVYNGESIDSIRVDYMERRKALLGERISGPVNDELLKDISNISKAVLKGAETINDNVSTQLAVHKTMDTITGERKGNCVGILSRQRGPDIRSGPLGG